MTDGDRLIIWFTFQGVHVGNGFPRMVDLKVDGAPVVWPEVRVLPCGEREALRALGGSDNLAMLDSTRRPPAD